MSQSPVDTVATPAEANDPPPVAASSTPMSRGMRETIESIAIALALAFLFKTRA